MKTILAAVDLSAVSDLVVAEAAALAHAVSGKVLLVIVLVEPIFVKEYAPPPPSIAKITLSQQSAVKERLAAIQRELQAKSIPAQVVVRRGSAALNILREAKKHAAAFIVIGSHGHTALFELLLGSTTQAVLKDARQPVVVIPAKMPRRVARKSPRAHVSRRPVTLG